MPCHAVPKALPFSTAPVPLQISMQDWLLSLPRQHCSKAGVRERTVCLGVDRILPTRPTLVLRGLPQVGPTLCSHRKWLLASRMCQPMGARARAGPSWHQRLALRSSGHWGRSWAASKPRGQPGSGVKRPALFAQGWRLPSGPLPADEDIRSGLWPTASKCSSTRWRSGPIAHLLILGCPVEMAFSIHVQQQQVTEEGDLGESG